MSQPKYTKLRLIILATTLFFALVPMLIVGIGVPKQFSSLYHDKTLREVENVARTKGGTIDVFMEERIAQLKTLAETSSYKELTEPGYLLSILRAMKVNSQSYVDLGVIAMDGSHAAYAGPYDLSDANYKEEAWFKETMRKGIFISDVFLGFRNFPHIIIAVMREEGNKNWILRATVDSEIFTSIVRDIKFSSHGDSFVLSKDKKLQTSSILAGDIMEPVALEWPRHGAEIVEENLASKKMIVAKVPLKQAPWILVVAENPSEHLAKLGQAELMSGVILALGLLALCLGTWGTTRKIVSYLEVADQQKAEYDAVLMQSSKMAALGKMATGIAHEINNPLMLIRENAGWIKDLLSDEDKEKLENYNEMELAATKVEQNVDRARNVTHRLLGFARRVDPVYESMPLNPIVDQAVAFLSNEAEFRGISIQKSFSEHNIRVATDVGQLQQVILNVLDNAIDALDSGGHITISTDLDLEDRASIHIRDTGKGIDPTVFQQIFDPFFTTKKMGEGTGLGLSICYSIMESLGGSIAAMNHKDGGAHFIISIPRTDAQS